VDKGPTRVSSFWDDPFATDGGSAHPRRRRSGV